MRDAMVQLKPGSFGEWLEVRSRGGAASIEELPCLSDLYPTYELQVRIAYLACAYGDGFDPYNAAACEDELRMRRELDAWTREDDVDSAYWERQFAMWQAAQPDEEVDVLHASTYISPWQAEQELDRRINASLPPQFGYKLPSKKRWVTDRKARYERRDGSPRGHWHDGVSHDNVVRLERAARTGMKRLLRDIRDGAIDPDAAYLTAQSNALNEELMNA